MYICKPERNVKQAALLLIISVAVTLLLFLLSTLIPQYTSFLSTMGFVAMMFGILFNVRFSLTEFEYIVSDGSFSVVKITGNRRQTVCNVDLSTAIDLIPKKDYDHLPSAEKAIIKYSLNQNMKADSFVYLCDFNGKKTMIEFEPNKEFVSILKHEIARAKENSDKDNSQLHSMQ